MHESTKRCCTCHSVKSLEDFNRYAKSDDGRQPRCRECQHQKRVEWYEANRESGIAKAREWNLANPDRVRQNDQNRYWRDPDKRRAQNRKSYAEHGARWKAAESEKRRQNLETMREHERAWRAANRESIADRKRRYRAENPNVRLQEKAKNHARRAAIIGGPSYREIAEKMAYYGGKCWICGALADSIDHVKPLSKGGAHALANLKPACSPCNSRKRARWYGVQRIDELTDWVLLRLAA